ncbi:hypothetical protein ABZ348_17965 [Streptomyces sp. NPDC005963]|uniref:hypothetical protein n=1 Tax=Streptomyces sp. NPDC005963 TaxID=3156721 RepID=UPI00340373EE
MSGHMNQHGQISKAERRQLAVAATTLGPWRTAALTGAAGGVVAFGLGALGGVGLELLAGALSFALMLFFIVGGAGAVIGGGEASSSGFTAGGGLPAVADGDSRSDRRIRRWAREHPWRVAVVPGALMALADVVVNQTLTGQSFIGGVEDALWMGVLVWVFVGLSGRFAPRKG